MRQAIAAAPKSKCVRISRLPQAGKLPGRLGVIVKLDCTHSMAAQTNNNSPAPVLSSFRFAVSATFSAEPLQPAISFWGRQLNVHFEIRFAPYNQLLQSLLDPAGEFAK